MVFGSGSKTTLLFMLILCAAATHAQIVDIDAVANCPLGNALQLPLTAGAYNVTQIDTNGGGAFTAWNAWGFVGGCDPQGANCTNGWLTSYRIVSADVPDDGYGGGIYETAELAFLNEAENASFVLPTDQTVSFYIGDSNCGDNLGGVSLEIAPGQVPTMPAGGMALLAMLLLALGSWLVSRRRSTS